MDDHAWRTIEFQRRAVMLRHLPNLLSGFRLLAAPLAAWAILAEHDTAALVIFASAGFSDLADGLWRGAGVLRRKSALGSIPSPTNF
jgi:cardiolipin synthase